jgi:hypothetical protein
MKIYKYQPVNINLLNSLRTQMNWYSKLSYLNDPHECFFIDNTGTSIYKNFISTLCVCCFSKNMDNLLMWSHYADSHRGVCLEWEVDEKQVERLLHNVKYENNLTIINKVERYESGHLLLDSNTNAKFLLQKFKVWEYEEELRVYRICENIYKKGELNPYLGNLTRIFFGKNANTLDIELVKHNVRHISNIEFKNVHLDTSTMKMSF